MFVKFCRVKNACVGNGRESECALDDVWMIAELVLKFVHPSASDLKGFVFLDFRKKIAEHCLFFIVQPCVIAWPSFLESS